VSNSRKLKPLSTTVFLGFAVLIVVTCVAVTVLGWFGMFLIGVVGLLISTRLELHDGIAVPDFDYGSSSVGIIARQNAERDRAGWQDQIEEKNRKARQGALIYNLNTIWLAMMALGLVMFSMHQI